MDLNAIRSKLNSLQQTNKGNGGNDRSLFWKPSVGKQVIRIVPNKFNKSNPFTEVYFHYGIGERTMISPINFGEKDPIVEFAKQLRNTSDKENKLTEVKINIPGSELIIKRETKTFEEGINAAVDNLKRQLKRSKEKHRDSLIS